MDFFREGQASGPTFGKVLKKTSGEPGNLKTTFDFSDVWYPDSFRIVNSNFPYIKLLVKHAYLSISKPPKISAKTFGLLNFPPKSPDFVLEESLNKYTTCRLVVATHIFQLGSGVVIATDIISPLPNTPGFFLPHRKKKHTPTSNTPTVLSGNIFPVTWATKKTRIPYFPLYWFFNPYMTG